MITYKDDGAKETVLENLQIKKAGLKVTLPRVKILQLLEGSEKRLREN